MTTGATTFEEVRALAWEARQAQMDFDNASRELSNLNRKFNEANPTYIGCLQKIRICDNQIQSYNDLVTELKARQATIENLKIEYKPQVADQILTEERSQMDAVLGEVGLLANFTTSPNRDVIIQGKGLIQLTDKIVTSKAILERLSKDQASELSKILRALADAFPVALLLINAAIDLFKSDKDSIEKNQGFLSMKSIAESKKIKEDEWNNGLKTKLTTDKETKYRTYQYEMVNLLTGKLNEQNAIMVAGFAYPEQACTNVKTFNANFGQNCLRAYFPEKFPQENNANSPVNSYSFNANKEEEKKSNNSHFHKQEPASSNNESPELGKLRTVLGMLQQHTYILHHGGETIKEKTYSKTAGLYVKKIKAFLKPIETEKDIDDASILIKEAQIAFEKNRKPTTGCCFFNLGARDKTTADLYKKCSKVLSENPVSATLTRV
ncbi:MAG: hypothetical protein WC785_10255 [Tatlockia sp.]|jgi:hypothetical protein